MERNTYERYGLSGNPFRGLTSESLDAVEMFHVSQSIDGPLFSLRDEVVEKENKAIIALMGEMGAGKTERLLLFKGAASKGVFCIYRNVVPETERLVGGIADDIVSGTKPGIFSNPQWLKTIKKVRAAPKKGYDPDASAMAVAAALDDKAPSFLLLNDFHNLEKAREPDKFVRFMHMLSDEIGPGVLVLIGTSERYFESLMADNPSLNERVHRKLRIPPLNSAEASLMVAKRLVAKRLVEDLEPLYPFTEESVGGINEIAAGNPRVLLKLADRVIDHAAQRRVLQIDMDAVHSALGQMRIDKYPSDCVTSNPASGGVDEQPVSSLASPSMPATAPPSRPVRQSRSLLTGDRWSKAATVEDRMSRCKCAACGKSYVVAGDSVIKRCPYCGASQRDKSEKSLFRG